VSGSSVCVCVCVCVWHATPRPLSSPIKGLFLRLFGSIWKASLLCDLPPVPPALWPSSWVEWDGLVAQRADQTQGLPASAGAAAAVAKNLQRGWEQTAAELRLEDERL
jgi:hypothetical protein